MCFGKVASPEPIKVEKPVFVRNPFLDNPDPNSGSAAGDARNRSSLVIPIGFEGRGGSMGEGSGSGFGPLSIGGGSEGSGQAINSAGVPGGVGPAGGHQGDALEDDINPGGTTRNHRQRQRDGRGRGGGPSRV